MSEVPGSRYVSMQDAAALIGVSERAARDWIRRYSIPTRGERPVLVDETALEDKLLELGRSPRKSSGSTSEPIDAAYSVDGVSYAPGETVLVPTSSMVEQGRVFADKLTEIAQRNETLALEVGMLRERTSQLERERDTLRMELMRLRSVQRRESTITPDAVESPVSDRDAKVPVETEKASPGSSGEEFSPSQKRRGWLSRLFGAD